MKYYIHKGGQQFGPYSREALNAFISAGELTEKDPAWAEGLSNWATVADVLKGVPETEAAPAAKRQQAPTKPKPNPEPMLEPAKPTQPARGLQEVPVPALAPAPGPAPAVRAIPAAGSPKIGKAYQPAPAAAGGGGGSGATGGGAGGGPGVQGASGGGTHAPVAKAYMVVHNGVQMGPYSPELLAVEIAQGRLSLEDRAWCTGMTEWRPLSVIMKEGNEARKALSPQGLRGGAVPNGSAPAPPVGPRAVGLHLVPTPPSLHWAIVLLLSICTLGLFGNLWSLLIFNWTRKLNSNSYPLVLTLLAIPMAWGAVALEIYKLISLPHGPGPQRGMIDLSIGMLALCHLILWLTALFLTRKVLVHYYNTREPIKLKLSPFLTLIFSTLYFQYHLSRIAKWKKTGIIP